MSAGVALVTGAGSGIGRAVAVGLAADGFSVVLAGRRADALQETAALIGTDLLVQPTDVRDVGSVDELFFAVETRFGRLDLLFNNAGVTIPAAPLEEVDLEQWRAVIEINLTGTFLCTQEAFRLMKAQTPPGGRIINNGSLSAHMPRHSFAAYTASKHALTGLTKAAALEGRPHHIACGQIDIGNAATVLTASFDEGTLQADGNLAREPTMDVEDVARAVVYMASLPLEANVLFLTVMATGMPFVGRG